MSVFELAEGQPEKVRGFTKVRNLDEKKAISERKVKKS